MMKNFSEISLFKIDVIRSGEV